ncbi:MAG: hypothetical protein ABI411_05130 [Tahibacter sp.]
MRFGNLGKAVSWVFGAAFVAAGTGIVAMATSGAVVSAPIGAFISGAAFILIGLCLATLPFSKRLALGIALAIAFVLAFGLLWLAFSPELQSAHPSDVQSAAITLVVLLLARVVLAVRRRCHAHDT